MRYWAVIAGALLASAVPFASAQEVAADHIETDRDSFTPATVTAGAGRLIVESGYSFIDNRNVPETHSFPELIARYGVNDWFELRIGSNYEVGGASNSISGGGGGDDDFASAEIETEAKVIYGLKAALSDQDGWMPRSVVIAQAATPTSGVETATHFVGTYAWGWELDENWLWDSAIRYGDGKAADDAFDRWAPSTVLKCNVAEQWNAHLEYFGVFTDGRGDELNQSYVSPGLHYLVTSDIEVGVRVGWGLGGDAANFFSNVGVGLRY
jgi:hypothetical protein